MAQEADLDAVLAVRGALNQYHGKHWLIVTLRINMNKRGLSNG